MKAHESDQIRTLVDTDIGGRIIPAGATGHVLEVLEGPEGYVVEFVIREATEAEDGDYEFTTLSPEQLEVVPQE